MGDGFLLIAGIAIAVCVIGLYLLLWRREPCDVRSPSIRRSGGRFRSPSGTYGLLGSASALASVACTAPTLGPGAASK